MTDEEEIATEKEIRTGIDMACAKCGLKIGAITYPKGMLIEGKELKEFLIDRNVYPLCHVCVLTAKAGRL